MSEKCILRTNYIKRRSTEILRNEYFAFRQVARRWHQHDCDCFFIDDGQRDNDVTITDLSRVREEVQGTDNDGAHSVVVIVVVSG